MLPGPDFVSADDLEELLVRLRQSLPDGSRTIFPPDSISWRVNRESALFLAATRAALLQLAHPWVATAIGQYSRTFQDPIRRFHRTFQVMFTISFGSLEQAFAASRQLHHLHQLIRGKLAGTMGRFATGTSYEANEVEALRWVYATLIDSSVLTYNLVLPPLSDAEREQYYSESRAAATLFGIPYDCWPQDWAGFTAYMKATLASDMLAVSASTRDMAHQLQNGAGLLMRPPFWYRALTIQLLPPRFRQEFGFPYDERERRSADRALRWIRHLYPHFPAVLRFVGPYNESLSRLSGQRPGLATRVSNRMWIGQPELFASQPQTPPRRYPTAASRQNLTES